MRLRVGVVASTLVLFGLAVACTEGGGSGDRGDQGADVARSDRTSTEASPSTSPGTSPTVADPATLSAHDVLAQAVAVVRGHEAEQYQWSVEDTPSGLLYLNGTWTAATGLAIASLDSYTRTDGTSKLGLIRVEDHVYIQSAAQCYVDRTSAFAASGRADDLTALVASPSDVLASLRPVSYDPVTLTMRATLPLRQAAPLLLIGVPPLGTVDVDDLTGRIPVTVSIEAEGPIRLLTIAGDDLRGLLTSRAGSSPALVEFVADLGELQFTDAGGTTAPSAPPAASLASGDGQGCDAGGT